MNAVLQCLYHIVPFTSYFLSNRYQNDVNEDNVMGTNGAVLKEWVALVNEMRYCEDTVTPRNFKMAVGRAKDDFSGFQQQDSTEFLMWICDMIHEDLNRVTKKPYIEELDCERMECVNVMGAHAWDGQKKRNDSVVAENMHGQFQSTCICGTCKKVSVKFDNYTTMNLGFPEEKFRILTVGVWRWRTNEQSNCRIMRGGGITNPKQRQMMAVSVKVKNVGTVGDVRREVAKTIKCDDEKLFMMEEYNSSFYQEIGHGDDVPLTEIMPTDVLCAYECHPFFDPEEKANCVHACIVQRDANEEAIIHPLVTSFDRGLSCTEVLWHVWAQVKRQMDPSRLEEEFAKGELTEKRMVEEFLVIKIHRSFEGMARKRQFEYMRADDAIFDEILPEDLADKMTYLTVLWSSEWIDNFFDENFEATSMHASVAKLGKQGEDNTSLEDMLEWFGKPEHLALDDNYYCSRCESFMPAIKTIKLRRLPNILVLGFKRYKVRNAYRTDKHCQFVKYPVTGLDMGKYVADTGDTSDNLYDLFGVILHYGRPGFGHYISYCRSWESYGGSQGGVQGKMDDHFYSYDDGGVQVLAEHEIVTEHAYCLFYRKRVFSAY
jgi:ubiquitin carboxyl-terminal hydrolase 4/11/15